ncbi:MAG: hypothetical protein E6G60_04320 [Actinobacteria bacterium]|nr:MAG: hypothetical protein E6G60_04320 [Actinomycetota bacterium]
MPSGEVVGERRRQRKARREAVDALHQVEGRAHHLGISAERERRGVRHRGAVKGAQDAELARHRVGRRRAARRAPEYPALSRPAQLEHLVGRTARDALDL